MMRTESPSTIVSLIASATEIVCALGLRERLVGVSHECDFPEDVVGLPVLSEPRMDTRLPGGQIDRAVRDLVREGLSVYRVRVEELERLRPGLIVTQDQCEVCAVSLRDVEEACSALTLRETRVCTLRPESLADILSDFRRVGEAAGVPERAEALAGGFERRIAAVCESVARRPRPRVACVEWLDPPMVAGGWIPEIVEMAGGEPVIVTSQTRFRTVTWEEIEAADADAVVLMPCGFTVGKTLEDLRDNGIAAPLRRLRAVKEGRCVVADGNAYFNRPGPRIADSAEILASIFHGIGRAPRGSAVVWPG